MDLIFRVAFYLQGEGEVVSREQEYNIDARGKTVILHINDILVYVH